MNNSYGCSSMIDSTKGNEGLRENELFNFLIYPSMFWSTLNLGLDLRRTVLSLHALLEPAEGKKPEKVEKVDFIVGSSMVSLLSWKDLKSSTCIFNLFPSNTSVLLSKGCRNKCLQTGWLKAREMYCLTVLETTSQKSRSWLDWFLLRVLRQNRFFFFISFFYLFILFVIEREREKRESTNGRGAEWHRERERILSRLHVQHGDPLGAWSQDHGIMTWAEIKSQILHQLSHPGAPRQNLFYASVIASGSSRHSYWV